MMSLWPNSDDTYFDDLVKMLYFSCAFLIYIFLYIYSVHTIYKRLDSSLLP
jgi:hypothetical protein